MFKRLFWMGIGASLGVGTSWWVTRQVRHRIEQLTPTRLTEGLAQRARSVGDGVRAAVADGRQAMHEQEDLLRGQLEARYIARK